MRLHFLKHLRRTQSKPKTPKGSSRPVYFRPRVEALEERVVLTTRIWTGGSILSNHWSDQFNWQNGVPVSGDSVFFPADAKQRTNVVDIDQSDSNGNFPKIFLANLRIAGGDYDIQGIDIHPEHVFSDSGSNTIENGLTFDSLHPSFGAVLEVAAGTLS